MSRKNFLQNEVEHGYIFFTEIVYIQGQGNIILESKVIKRMDFKASSCKRKAQHETIMFCII